MNTSIRPYLYFNGNCKEALSFYEQCLGANLSLMTVADSPMAAQMPDKKDAILHGVLMNGDTPLLMASDDIMGTMQTGNNIALGLNFMNEADLNDAFAKLSAGGTVTHPVKKEFWGALFGMCTDKFGINWMVNYDEKQQS